MNFKGILVLLTALIISVFLYSCKTSSTGPDSNNTNPDIVAPDIYPINQMAVWNKDMIYTIPTMLFYRIDSNYKVIEKSGFGDQYGNYIPVMSGSRWNFIEINDTGTKLLLVSSKYSDVSAGSLYEFDIPSKTLTLLKDSSNFISSAKYFRGTDSRIIYYKYGWPIGNKAGYYILDKSSGKDTLVLSHIAKNGTSETLNCFDLHPNNQTLVFAISQTENNDRRAPKLGLYNFGSNKIDTLPVAFDFYAIKIGLWLRFNSTGSKILYCSFPKGIYGDATFDDSQVGIIEFPSLNRKVLNVNTNSPWTSVQLAPRWGSGDRTIIYDSGKLSNEGVVGRRHIYILKNIK
jgi:hypothetical protein